MIDKAESGRSPRRVAMDLLARREHSAAELREKLRKREIPESDIEEAVDSLVAEGLISDARFVEAYASAARRRGQGPVRIRAELERRGVARDLIGAGLDPVEESWIELARSVRIRKFGAQPAETLRDRARQMRFLQYRGFTGEQVRAALDGDPDQ